jgi:hypothetical protein
MTSEVLVDTRSLGRGNLPRGRWPRPVRQNKSHGPLAVRTGADKIEAAALRWARPHERWNMAVTSMGRCCGASLRGALARFRPRKLLLARRCDHGHAIALIAVEWLQRWSAQKTMMPRTPEGDLLRPLCHAGFCSRKMRPFAVITSLGFVVELTSVTYPALTRLV